MVNLPSHMKLCIRTKALWTFSFCDYVIALWVYRFISPSPKRVCSWWKIQIMVLKRIGSAWLDMTLLYKGDFI